MNSESKPSLFNPNTSNLIDTLNDQKTEWTLRLKALQQIQDFLLKEDTTLQSFLEAYKNISTHITIQLKDLRSAIVKESIKILTIGSNKFRTTFDNFVCKFLDLLFQLSASTTNAISKSASDGVKTILENIYSAKILTKILENSKQKPVQIKILACECLYYSLTSFPKSILDTIDNDQLVSVVRAFVCESGKLREIGKDCFLAFSDKYPEKTEKFVQSIIPVSKKLAEELRGLIKTFNIDPVSEFPTNVEISAEEWAIFDKLDVFSAVRLAVTQTNFQTNNEIQLEILIEKADNQNWNVREKAFGKMLEVLQSHAQNYELEAIVKKVVEHVKDSHIKVINACMECLIIIAKDYSIMLTAYFPELLQVILEISLNKKEELSENANVILEKLLETYPPDDLLIHFLSISSNKTGVKFALIEIIQYLLEISESFCFSKHNMNLLCKKLSAMCIEGSKSTIVSAIKALEKACDKNVFGTLQGILELPYEEQSLFKKYCQDYSNLLDEMLRGYSKSMIPNSIDVIEEVEEEDLTGSILEPSEQFEDFMLKTPEEILSNLQYYLTKCELRFENIQELILILAKQLNSEHNEDSKKALRNLSAIAKYSKSDKVRVELLSVLSKLLSWDSSSLQRDVDIILKNVIEKMNTGSAVIGILESLKKCEPPGLQTMLEYLMEIIKDRGNISFFGKEIGVRLKEFFGHPHPEVRKNVVLALAELLGKVDEDGFLAIFNQSQQKIIEIYRQKLAAVEN
ncbi:hypothetical protein SteCoe_14898 [Stentor coeruleus]|uniref:TOG domain-containing protein n=1 Tax=Stentor coeruleus TaxID=5963 RepID=A0A1R2C4Y0_9CILI|nr:hypothetical protein SteCoe_14898 [Stentor coeruleus]